MLNYLSKFLILTGLCLLLINPAYAHYQSVEFFLSNNTKKLALKSAYKNLTNSLQYNLQAKTIDLMQKNHIKQGRLEAILGHYQMENSQISIGENSEIFISSPCQTISMQKILNIAQQLAKTFQQESVAVFIPKSQETVSHIKVYFISHSYNVSTLINLLQKKIACEVFTSIFSSL